jgi:hypothetical protein
VKTSTGVPPLGGQVIVQLQASPSAWPSKKSRLPEVAASWAPAPLHGSDLALPP